MNATNSSTCWSPETTAQRVRHLCQRFALSEPAALLLAHLVYGEARQ